jgi:hypothetical protein
MKIIRILGVTMTNKELKERGWMEEGVERVNYSHFYTRTI